MTRFLFRLVAAGVLMLVLVSSVPAQDDGPAGWQTLFNGQDLNHWKLTDGAKTVWSVKDGVIDCEPIAGVGKSLWSKESFEDFVLHVEWRIKKAPTTERRPLIGSDGRYLKDEDGNVRKKKIKNADSGIYLRGKPKSQVNIWNWPVGSGEVYGYRTDGNMPDDVRAGVTPEVRADRPVGEWNTFVITMEDDRLSVLLNGKLVINNVRLPGVPDSGPIALQHHGGYNRKKDQYHAASSVVQFRDIHIKPLD